METNERPVLPQTLSEWIGNAPMRDVSGWSGDKTYFINKDSGAYLKIARKGSLSENARMQRWWGEKGLSAKVLTYLSEDSDYLLTAPVPGHDGIWQEHLADPERLSRIFGESLRRLHDADYPDCPFDALTPLLKQAETTGFEQWRLDDLKPFIGEAKAEDCAGEIAENAHLLKPDVLVHGDYCLPNIMLENWQLTGFIDIGLSGKGDRHTDLVWGLWTVLFNLKDIRYADIFLDAYGRDAIDPKRLRICALLSALEE